MALPQSTGGRRRSDAVPARIPLSGPDAVAGSGRGAGYWRERTGGVVRSGDGRYALLHGRGHPGHSDGPGRPGRAASVGHPAVGARHRRRCGDRTVDGARDRCRCPVPDLRRPGERCRVERPVDRDHRRRTALRSPRRGGRAAIRGAGAGRPVLARAQAPGRGTGKFQGYWKPEPRRDRDRRPVATPRRPAIRHPGLRLVRARGLAHVRPSVRRRAGGPRSAGCAGAGPRRARGRRSRYGYGVRGTERSDGRGGPENLRRGVERDRWAGSHGRAAALPCGGIGDRVPTGPRGRGSPRDYRHRSVRRPGERVPTGVHGRPAIGGRAHGVGGRCCGLPCVAPRRDGRWPGAGGQLLRQHGGGGRQRQRFLRRGER